MAKPKKRTDTRAIGLDIGLAFSKFLTGKENLHYGLWDPAWNVCAENIGRAQEAYTEKLFRLLPKRKNLRILDIGGGAGETAKKLVAIGHHVDIVIPSPFLAQRCRENAGPTATVHECLFEDFQSGKTFDICLFSESFQYIPLTESLPKAQALLAPDGAIIIADCFRTPAFFAATDEGAKVGGGHALSDFHAAIASHPLTVVSLEDITTAVAPSVDVEQELFNVIGHAITRIDTGIAASHPLMRGTLRQMVKLLFSKRRRARIDQRLNEKVRSSENFCRYNTYVMVKLTVSG
jgi:SAM-dependent methyltransferase